MPTFIHETAIVSPQAAIGESCYIGPFCTVGEKVHLGDGVRLESHVVVDGDTSIGSSTHVFPFASIGLAPQDLKYGGEPTRTEIGERNQIREFVTIHRGTAGGGGVTRIGDGNLLMAQAHVAHDQSSRQYHSFRVQSPAIAAAQTVILHPRQRRSFNSL